MEPNDLSLLQTVPAYHLQTIAKNRLASQLTLSKTVDSSQDLAIQHLPEIAELLFDPSRCRQLLHTLNEAETCVLRELVDCGGRANSRDMALYLSLPGSPFSNVQAQMPEAAGTVSRTLGGLTSSRAVGEPSIYPVPHPHGAFEQALHHLLLLGLLFWGKQTNFVGRDYASGVYDGILIVPPTVIEAANQEWLLNNAQKRIEVSQTENPGEGMRLFLRSLYLYWSLVAGTRDGLALVNSHLLSRTSLRQVMERMTPLNKFWQGLNTEQAHTEAEIPYLRFLRLILMKLGLLVERQSTLYAAPAQDFFALPVAECVWRCFHLWLDTPFWNELTALENIVVQPGLAPLDPAHEEVVYSRQLVVEHVLQTTPATWHAISTFISRMKLHIPYLLFPRQYGSRSERYSMGSNPYGWNFRLRRGWLTHREGWHLVEGGFIRALLSGPLFWLGIVELDKDANPDTFRLAQGARLVESGKAPTQADLPAGRLIVQPNFDLVVLAPVYESLLVELDRFAEQVRLELIAQYRLSKASVTRAVQLGLTAEGIQHTLEEAVSGPIPQNVQYSLQEWERQARRIELWESTTLLETDNPAFLDELCADPVAHAWLVRRLSPSLAEVRKAHLVQLQELLWQRDYLPALTSASQHQNLLTSTILPTHEKQWRLHTTGLLQPCYALPNLYLATELAHVTEIDEATGWQKITRESLQQAISAGFELGQIIHFLQNYCSDSIPASFLIRLKLWGGGYPETSSLQVENAPLLSLSQQTLQDIMADEEIGNLLSETVPAEQRLIRVPPQNLARVVQLLQERGFDVF
jgi:hypothetical protein